MNPSRGRVGIGLRDRLPPTLRTGLARLLVAGLDLVRGFSASGLARGMWSPSRTTVDDFAAFIGDETVVSVVRVQEATPRVKAINDLDVPRHRVIDTTYVCMDSSSCEVTLRNNHVVGPRRTVISESKAPMGELQISMARLEPVERRPGTTLYLSNIWVDNYYHWMCFSLPNLRIATEVLGVTPDYFYVGRPLRRWHLETLAAFGVQEHQVLRDGTASDRIVAVFPDRSGALDAKALGFVRRTLSSRREPRSIGRRLYVGRGGARHRRLLNAEECEKMLQAKYGFEIVTMDGLTVAEQAETFASADVIVAPHGAALTNLMFASSAAKVVELVPDDPTDTEFSYFAELCAFVGCEYARVPGERLHGSSAMPGRLRDIRIDIETLDSTIAALVTGSAP